MTDGNANILKNETMHNNPPLIIDIIL